MAIAAAPYVHVRAADATPGKKETAEQTALTAERGTEWEVLLEPPSCLAEADRGPAAAGAPEAALPRRRCSLPGRRNALAWERSHCATDKPC